MAKSIVGVVKRPARAGALLALALATLLAGISAAQGGAPPAGDLDQCANGPLATPSHCDAIANQWQNGNLNGNQAHYLEGDSVPYRLRFSNLDVTKTHTVTIGWDTTKAAKHALDYLTSFDRTEPLANPCIGVSGCSLSGAKNIFPIPVDPAVSASGATQVPGNFTLFNGTIASLSPYSIYAGSYAGDSATKITLSFTTTVRNPVLAWGGHIAERADWGQTNSAVSISGSPFHMRLLDIDGKGGNQDRSLSNDAVIYPASVSVIKDAVPDSPQDFTFTTTGSGLSAFSLDDDSDPTLSNTQVFADIINFDTKTVTESDPLPYFALTELVCTEDLAQDSTASVATRTATISLQEAESVVCTFTNVRQPGTLRVIKNVINDNGGTAVAGDFTLHVHIEGSDVAASPAPGSVLGSVYTLPPAAYVVSEDAGPAGYQLAGFGGDCDGAGNVTVVPGQEKVCVITNDDIPPRLNVVKHVINDNGGTAAASVFTMSVNGPSASPASFPGDEAGTTVALNAGSYDVSESSVFGYTQTSAVGCSGSIAIGETKTCTITNDDVQPVLVVIKHVVNDNGGTAVASDFTLSVSGASPSPSSFPGEEAGTTVALNAGSFDVSEDRVFGYTQTSAIGCSGSIAVGEVKTCTVTNDDIQPALVVIKHVVNNNGGTAAASDFTMSIAGANPSPASFPGDELGTTVALDAGSFDVSESSVSGYTQTSAVGCSGSIAVGETKTCTVTNDDIQPVLVVIKHVVNDNGGTAVASDFTMSVAGANPSPASFPGDEAGTTVALDAGNYDVSESSVLGYTQTSAVGCSGSIAIGETKTCTITNDDIQPQLIVIKHVVNDNGGTAVASDFTMSVAGANPSPASFPGDELGTTVALDAGSFDVSESSVFGYTQTSAVGCSGSIAIGDTKTCTITNDDVQPVLVVIKHVVNDNGGTAVAGDFTMSVAGANPSPASFPGDEAGTTVALNAGSYDVSETSVVGYTQTSAIGCSGSIAVGETKTCTITNGDIQPKLIVFKHVINDNGGTAVAGDFTMRVTGTNAGPAKFPGYEAGTMVKLSAGTYSVSESGPSGYAASFSADCAGAIAIGETKVCFVTNDDTKAAPRIRTTQRWTLNDKAILSDIRPSAPDAADATVLFKLFSDPDCTVELFSEWTSIINNLAETSIGYSTATPGTYYWTALYSGDAYNEPRLSECGSETTTITAVQPVPD